MNGFKGEIEKDEKVLEAHARDASVFKVVPSAVLYAIDRDDVVAAVKGSSSLSVRAGGTCMSGGSLNTGNILNMTRHMSAINIDVEAMTATVEMGAYFRDIEILALKHGLMFAPYTSSHLICGIGGMIGNNASGEKSIRYGATIDNVLSLEVVLADGTVIETGPKPLSSIFEPLEMSLLDLAKKYGEDMAVAVGNVPKVSSGYRLEKVVVGDVFDMTKIFVGAQGTLGIITKAKLKLVPIPTYTKLLIISIDSIHDLPFILNTVMKHNPEGVETFDINTYNRAKFLNAEDTSMISRYVHSTTSSLILTQFSETTEEETRVQAEACLKELISHDISVEMVEDQLVADAAWRVRRLGYSVMCNYNEAGYRAVPCIEDIIVPISSFDVFIEELVVIMKKHDINYGYHGHIGDGALRIIPIFNFNDPEVADKIIAFMRDVFVLVKRVKGNTSADHGDGIIRTPFLKDFYGEELYGAFEQIKNLFDPEGILNPKKKIGGTEDEIRKWLDR